jgi:LPS export ABC transporter protein LptC
MIHHQKIVTLFFLALCIMGMISCENDIRDIEAIDRKVDNVDRYKDIKITYSDSAKIRVAITAALMESHFETGGIQEDHFPKGVYVEFFDERGDPTSWLSAKTAYQYHQKNLIVVRDSVALYSIEGDTLRTEELIWNSKEERIFTPGYFRYMSQDKVITGRKFDSDQNFSQYSYENMSGQIQAKVPE